MRALAIGVGVVWLGLGSAAAQPAPRAPLGAPQAEAPNLPPGDSPEPAAAEPAPEGAPAGAQIVDKGRDPFRPFTLDLRPESPENEIATPLQRYELPQLRVAGVLLDITPPRAMLQDASGMGYIVMPGTPIGRRRGVVKAIEPRRVIVEETILDFYGREQVHQVVLEMPREDKPQSAGQE